MQGSLLTASIYRVWQNGMLSESWTRPLNTDIASTWPSLLGCSSLELILHTLKKPMPGGEAPGSQAWLRSQLMASTNLQAMWVHLGSIYSSSTDTAWTQMNLSCVHTANDHYCFKIPNSAVVCYKPKSAVMACVHQDMQVVSAPKENPEEKHVLKKCCITNTFHGTKDNTVRKTMNIDDSIQKVI